MARKEIGNPMDDTALNNTNHNFIELYDDFKNVVDKVSDEAFQQVINGSKIDWSQMVDTISGLPSGAKEGETRGVKSDNKIYRFDGTQWVPIAEINLNPISEVDARLTTQLTEKASGEVFRWQQGGTSGSETVINVIQGYEGNAIAPTIRGAVISGGGGVGQELVIGGFTDKVVPGNTEPNLVNPAIINAHYAVIGGGYNSVNNALAGVLTAFHSFIGEEATHGVIHGGSVHKMIDGDYGAIVGGTGHIFEVLNGGAYSFIGSGHNHKMHGKFSGIIGGTSHRIGMTNTEIEGSFIGGGRLNSIDGNYAFVPAGWECKATKDFSMARGKGAVANNVGESVFTTGKFKTAGDSGQSTMHLFRQTTDGIMQQLLLDDNNSTIVALGVNTSLFLKASVVGFRVDAEGYASFNIYAHVTRGASGAPVLKSLQVEPIYKSDPLYDADITVTAIGYQVRCKGYAGHSINWTGKLEALWARNI